MADRQSRFLLKRSNVSGKLPTTGQLKIGEVALNTADVKMYAGYTGGDTGTTASEIRQVGWDRLSTESGGTVNGDVYINSSFSANTFSLINTPTQDDGLTQLLARESSTGEIQYRSAASLLGTGFTDTYVESGEFSNGTLTLTRTDAFNVVVTGFTSDDNYVTGGTYNTNTNSIDFSGTNVNTTFSVNLSNLDLNDTYVTGGTVTQSVTTDSNNGLVTLSYINNEGGTYTLPFTDSFVTGGTLNPSTGLITLDYNDSNLTGAIDISSLDLNDTFSTGITTPTLVTNNLNIQSFNITGNDGFTNIPISLTDTFVTGGTHNNGTITFKYNDGTKSSFNVTGLDSTDTFSTGTTNTILPTNNSNTQSKDITGNEGFTDFTVSFTDTFSTGMTFNGSTIRLDKNDGNFDSTVITGLTRLNVTNDLTSNGLVTINSNLILTGTSDLQGVISNSLSDVTFGDSVLVQTGNTLTSCDGIYTNYLESCNGTGGTLTVNSNIYTNRITGGTISVNEILILGSGSGSTDVGDSVFKGYGEMYMSDNAVETVLDGISESIITGLTITGSLNRLTYTGDTSQKYHITATLTAVAAANGQLISITVYKNGVATPNIDIEQQFGTSKAGLGLNGIVEMNTNDYVDLRAFNNSSNKNLTVSHLNMTMVQV